MNDLIDRRLIDADALKEELCKKYSHFDQRINISPVLSLIRDAPAIDAVQVVRCKDCIYQSKGENESESWNLCIFRPWLYIPTSDNHFCGYGEQCLRMRDRLEALPSVQPEGWMERNKDRILQAGKEGREVEFRIGGRLFAIREKAQ